MKKFALMLCKGLVFYAIPASAQTDVLTQHNNLSRTGWNDQETQLNTRNVKPGSFGKLYTLVVDDLIFAQPLVASQVDIPGLGTRNVLYAATVNNSVYAFDADLNAAPFWQVNLNPPGTRPPRYTDFPGACSGHYRDFSGNIGVIGTPVIDRNSQTIYLVTRSVSTDGNLTFSQYFHALDIRTGAEKTGSPVLITAQVNGQGSGNVNGVISFDPQKNNQRPGLLLLNGVVYIGYASHCDWEPYHGWLLGYDAATLQQKIVYNVTPEGREGGIWMSGAAPSADAAGNIYLSTGNGTVGAGNIQSDLTNRGESLLKLVPSGQNLVLGDFFTPSNWSALEASDLDFGVTEAMLIPGLDRVLTGSKDGKLYLADLHNLGGFNSTFNNVVQTIDLGSSAHLRSSLGYYKGATHEYVYAWSENSALKAFPVNPSAGNLNAAGVVNSGLQGPIGNSGAMVAISSNGAVDSTGILWVSHASNCDANQSVCPGILRAIDANDVTKELWNSSVNPADAIGKYAKFVCPTIANGKVYMATFSNQLAVYGLQNSGPDTCSSPNIALNKPVTASSAEPPAVLPAANAFDGNLSTRWSSAWTDNEYIYVDLGQSYNICRVILHWESAIGKDFDIRVSSDAQNWATAGTVRGNTLVNNTINLKATGRYVRMQGITRGTNYGYSLYEMEVYGVTAGTCQPPQNRQISDLQQNSASLSWDPVPNATGYTVEYKTITDAGWTIVTSMTPSVTLQGLSCGTDYLYQVAVSCSSGESSGYSASSAFSTGACTAVCGPLPTRWTSSDIGNIGMAGSACFDGIVYSLQGSGADIGGNADAFRYAYVTLSGDEQFIARIATQDGADPANKVGLMMRESISPGSRNAFVAISSGGQISFQYRNITDGITFTPAASPGGITTPCWLRLSKTGSVYAAYWSPDGFNWTQLGTAADLGFGGNGVAVYSGFAITSHNNGLLSTGTADNFSQSAPLPVYLQRFTGRNAGQYVSLEWTTASEQNNDHFEVERSSDGGHFDVISVVRAVGNSNTLQRYAAEDRQPLAGVGYYRLKQVDLDGKFQYSPVILVRFGSMTSPLLFPNPASTFFTLVAGLEQVREVTVYDITGRKALRMLNAASGSSLSVPCGNLAAGIYIVEIRTATQKYFKRIIKR